MLALCSRLNSLYQSYDVEIPLYRSVVAGYGVILAIGHALFYQSVVCKTIPFYQFVLL